MGQQQEIDRLNAEVARLQAEAELHKNAAKLLLEELNESTQQAQASSRAKEIFLVNMSHEIRTPLNAILGMSKLLTQTTQNSQQKTYTNAIVQSAENLILIINDILDLSKIQAGQVNIERAGFNMDELVSQLEKILRYKSEEKGLELNTATSVHVPRVLMGDPYRINQILYNLVGNAIKFTEKGSVELWCKLEGEKDGHNQISFSLKDTGIGIDPEYLKHLDQDFSQEDGSVTRKFGGTGLGLSISRRLINLMGGEMNIQSKKGEGTLITFTLSLETGNESDLPKRSHSTTELKGYQRELLNKKILLVEDNEFNRLLANTILTTYGAIVTEAWNGKIATDLISEQQFDLVVMDIQMPVMNGFEATRYIRETLKLDIPILALTANVVRGEKAKCLNAGMDDYIAKPFEETHLVKTICALLQQEAEHLPEPIANPETTGELYSLVTLKETAGADDAFIKHMLKTFVKQGTESLAQIDKAIAEKDIEALKAIVHKMKPSINYLKMRDISPLVYTVQDWEKGFTAVFDDVLQELKQKLLAVMRQMEADMPDIFL